jgi:hypothetical protein
MLKFCLIPVFLCCLAFQVFSQDANAPRYRALSDSMESTLTSSNTKLGEFDKSSTYNGNGKVYITYRHKYDSLSKSLQESESRLNRLIQGRAPANHIKQERDKYEGFIKQLETVKSEYDQWLSSVQ